jgi:hypothetical protein
VESLEAYPPAFLPGAGYAYMGYLQIRIEDRDGARRWLSPGAVLGGFVGYAALLGDTSLVYLFTDGFQEHLASWHEALTRVDGSREARPIER